MPQPGTGLKDANDPHHLTGLGLRKMGMVDRRDRVGDPIVIVAIGRFEEVLLPAEDGAAQIPVALKQRGAVPQQMEGDPHRTEGVKATLRQ